MEDSSSGHDAAKDEQNDRPLFGKQTSNGGADDEKKNRLRREIESLHQEMEVTGYAKGKMGHKQRKVPRDISKVRTQKRKLLEKLDDSELAILGDEDELENYGSGEADNRSIRSKRLRGSKVAVEDSVIQGSMVFSTTSSINASKEEQDVSDNNDRFHGRDEEDEDTDGELSETETTKPIHDESESSNQLRATQKNPKASKPGKSSGKSGKKRRKMYRLRNFQSLKMAEKHGSAIAAHARGQPGLAIEQLKMVAKAAPSAPQVYSSLGMVYEDMLKESIKRQVPLVQDGQLPLEGEDEKASDEGSGEVLIPSHALAEQRELATKAYGSYHIAAILCKKDFTLWVRAADSALDIAEIHNKVMVLPSLSKRLLDYHCTERRRWQEEALRDYVVADNLKPPGIDVPAKLAWVHIELGNLSEALTILTDLKNRAGYDFQSSYKAWMLYSDLMLRLGHECIQWSKGVQTNDNYMFRRWLRKFSKIFDWQERRLQGLSLALEAAAGTENVKELLVWIRNRIMQTTQSAAQSQTVTTKESSGSSSELHPQDDMAESSESTQKLKSNIPDNENELKETANIDKSTAEMNSQLAREKNLLLMTQSRDLDFFDKTTTDMSLMPDSTALKEREDARGLLLKGHEAAMTKLLEEYDQKESDLSSEKKEEETVLGMNTSPLPISGSIRQVCSIASELIKHLLGLELYEGARLVGDAVSSYMRERARRYHGRIEAKKKADEWQQNLLDSPFFVDSYDDDNVSSEDVDLTYLSDEETLLGDNDEDSELVKSLSSGALTPELRVLYGLALIGEGGRNFIAAKCLEAIHDLKQETDEWLSDEKSEGASSAEPLWLLFRRAMTEELGRTGAYAFTADVLRKANKEREWAFHLSSSFRNHVESLKDENFMDKVMNPTDGPTHYVSFRKNQVTKVILEACKFEMYTIDAVKEPKFVLNRCPNFDRATQLTIAEAVLATLVSIVPQVWYVDNDGVLPPICGEIVEVAAKCIRWFSNVLLKDISYSKLKTAVDQCTRLVSYLCGNSIPELKGKEDNGTEYLNGTRGFPVVSSWQSTEFRTLSICTYNFAVACNVSLFSGWESEEFSMKILKRKHNQFSHFGVHIGDRRLAGCLPSNSEDALEHRWESMAEAQPSFPKLDFAGKMKTVKQSEWFQAEAKSREQTLRKGRIATYVEEHALDLFLGYAAMCINLSRSETDKKVATKCQQLALSIMLPLSQFCLDETLWDSDIGEAASTLASYEEWQILAGNTEYQPVGDREGLYPKRIRKSGKKVYDKKVQEWIEGVNSPTSKDFIPIPNDELQRVWMQAKGESFDEPNNIDAKTQMQKVEKALRDLRSCYTYAAAEKACLNLSIALLEMAAFPNCYDPFTCLQQAASFASQATKSGHSDMVYRQSLPEMSQCSPREALVILGRADCLQGVYFPNEAAYLCSFVARVCRLHRDSREANYEWNDRWKVVAIYAYNVSVMIRITVSSILDHAMQKEFMSAWERDVVEELERARREGRTWINTLTKTAGDASSNVDPELDSSGSMIKNLNESNGEGRELSAEVDMNILWQGEQAQSPTQFKSTELKVDVGNLLSPEMDKCEENDDSSNEIILYSV